MQTKSFDYYINRKRKIIDFLVGLAAVPLIYWLSFYVLTGIAWFIDPSNGWIMPAVFYAAIAAFFAFLVFLGRSRRFIVIGVFCAIIIPIALAYGYCLIAFSIPR